MLVVYKIENNADGRVYIGQTNSLQRRMIQHRCEKRRCVDKSINKYGIKSFAVSVIDEAKTRDELNEKEKYWIQFYDCRFPKGYNFTDGGDGSPGHTMSEENKIKLRDSRIGYICSAETRQKMRVAKLGRTISDEQKKKQSEALKGIVFSEERKRNISKGLTGQVFTEERRLNASIARMGEKNHNYGKHFSEDHKRKISESNMGKVHIISDESRQRMHDARSGVPRSEETKRKISASSKGKKRGPLSDAHKDKIRNAKRGSVMSEEQKAKISKAMTGYKHSDEAKAKISRSRIMQEQKKAGLQELQRACG